MGDEQVTWYPRHNRPRARDGHILAKVNGVIYSGVYLNKTNRFVFDLLDFDSEDWSNVEMWCYYPKGTGNET